jgi:hypothetical protein
MAFTSQNLVTMTGTVLVDRELSIRVDIDGFRVWLPKSVIEDWPDEGDTGEIIMPEWLAIEKGLV